MRGAALHDVLYAFFLSCQTNFFHFTLKLCFTFPAKLYIINAKRSKSKVFQHLCVCDNNKTLLSENFIQSNIFQRSISHGRSGSKNSFPAGQKRPHAGQGDRRAGLTDQPGRVQPHPQTGDGRHHQRLHRHPEPPGRPRICGRLISLSVAPSKQDAFLELLQTAARCCSATTSPVPIPSWSK